MRNRLPAHLRLRSQRRARDGATMSEGGDPPQRSSMSPTPRRHRVDPATLATVLGSVATLLSAIAALIQAIR